MVCGREDYVHQATNLNIYKVPSCEYDFFLKVLLWLKITVFFTQQYDVRREDRRNIWGRAFTLTAKDGTARSQQNASVNPE